MRAYRTNGDYKGVNYSMQNGNWYLNYSMRYGGTKMYVPAPGTVLGASTRTRSGECAVCAVVGADYRGGGSYGKET